MRRIGGVLFLIVVAVSAASCDKKSGTQTVAAVATTTVAQARTEAPASTDAPTTTAPVTSTSTSTTAVPAPTTTTNAVRTTVATTTVTAPATTAVATTAPRTTTTTAAAVAPSSGCDPNYSGACVPIASDVDCNRKDNGPAYVDAKNFQVVGKDIYGLDADHNGIACES